MEDSESGKGLSERDREIYEWQLDVPGMGEEGQAKLRNTTALVSRIGGLGGPLALSLAAAGIGKLILVHGGELRPDDLNRQILMRHDHLGKSRVAAAAETLRTFNPHVEVETVAENFSEGNAAELVARADIVFDAAPLFEERFLMNRECVAQQKPLIDCAMYNMEGQVIPIVPGETPCLACLYPEVPAHWKRRFPVIGAVSALIANIGAMEGIKLIAGLSGVNLHRLIYFDTAAMKLRKVKISRNPDCKVCAKL
ncbi:MAG: HesA/MoeB/ThiF family protein [Verrucomicrobia bacterium]|nr:HesA/MoeB/ThiF family protein [Verrucomicrobiota bacterium]